MINCKLSIIPIMAVDKLAKRRRVIEHSRLRLNDEPQ